MCSQGQCRHARNTSTRVAARHEAGHVAVARGVGGQGVSASIDGGGSGQTHVGPTGDPVKEYAITRGGQLAARTGAGCAGDRALLRSGLREVPAGERAQVKREGEALARRIVASSKWAIRRDAARLEREGRI